MVTREFGRIPYDANSVKTMMPIWTGTFSDARDGYCSWRMPLLTWRKYSDSTEMETSLEVSCAHVLRWLTHNRNSVQHRSHEGEHATAHGNSTNIIYYRADCN